MITACRVGPHPLSLVDLSGMMPSAIGTASDPMDALRNLLVRS
jgi:hypothetical protein